MKTSAAKLTLIALAAAALPAFAENTESPAVARVGDLEVSADELRRELAELNPAEIGALRADPQQLNQYVRGLLMQRLILREAEARKWAEPEEMKRRLEQARQRLRMLAYLESVADPGENFPSDAELRAAYEANKDALLEPRAWRLAQIFISSEQHGGEKAKEKLAEVEKALKSETADFAALAAAHSDAATAGQGGEIGWLAEPQIQPAVREALPGIDLNGTTRAIEMADGWNILKVLDIREPRIPTFDQVKDNLAAALRQQKAAAAAETYVAELLKENPIAINEVALPAVLPAETAAP